MEKISAKKGWQIFNDGLRLAVEGGDPENFTLSLGGLLFGLAQQGLVDEGLAKEANKILRELGRWDF